MSLVLQGVDYGPVQCASGAMGWFGEGYWYHRYVPGLNWKGCTFVSKTTTLNAREGNMPLDDKGQAEELFPRCVVVKFREGAVLNSVGLSGPGAEALLATGEWQKRDQPFFLSFMSIAATKAERVDEAIQFVRLIQDVADEFISPFGIQVNLSCPNTGHDPSEIATEAREILGIFQGIRRSQKIPIVPKLNVLYPVEALVKIEDLCDALCISNTLPWGTLPADVDWARLFGGEWVTNQHGAQEWLPLNPLKSRGINGGGLSGAPLLSLVAEWVEATRGRGIELPINAGGGILRPKDVDVLYRAGADSVFLGSIAILRGWRVRATVRRARKLMR